MTFSLLSELGLNGILMGKNTYAKVLGYTDNHFLTFLLTEIDFMIFTLKYWLKCIFHHNFNL